MDAETREKLRGALKNVLEAASIGADNAYCMSAEEQDLVYKDMEIVEEFVEKALS